VVKKIFDALDPRRAEIERASSNATHLAHVVSKLEWSDAFLATTPDCVRHVLALSDRLTAGTPEEATRLVDVIGVVRKRVEARMEGLLLELTT